MTRSLCASGASDEGGIVRTVIGLMQSKKGGLTALFSSKPAMATLPEPMNNRARRFTCPQPTSAATSSRSEKPSGSKGSPGRKKDAQATPTKKAP